MLILDWESYQNSAWGNTDWAQRFVDEVHSETGVWPVIYVQESALWQVANCANDCGVWVAWYASMNWHSWKLPNYTPKTGAFKFLTGWQFTGGDMDRSIFFLDANGWDKIANPAGAKKPSTPAPKLNPKPTPAKPAPSARNWVNALGDRWVEEHGTFTSNCAINLGWGARTTSSLIGTLPAGSVIKYDAYSRHSDYVCLRQPRSNGQYGYLVCWNADNNEPFGTFK